LDFDTLKHVLSFLLDRVSLHISQQVTPRLALWGQSLVAHLNSGFSGMATPAKDLQIRQGIGQIRPVTDGQNVVTFQTPPLTTLDALPAITV